MISLLPIWYKQMACALEKSIVLQGRSKSLRSPKPTHSSKEPGPSLKRNPPLLMSCNMRKSFASVTQPKTEGGLRRGLVDFFSSIPLYSAKISQPKILRSRFSSQKTPPRNHCHNGTLKRASKRSTSNWLAKSALTFFSRSTSSPHSTG